MESDGESGCCRGRPDGISVRSCPPQGARGEFSTRRDHRFPSPCCFTLWTVNGGSDDESGTASQLCTLKSGARTDTPKSPPSGLTQWKRTLHPPKGPGGWGPCPLPSPLQGPHPPGRLCPLFFLSPSDGRFPGKQTCSCFSNLENTGKRNLGSDSARVEGKGPLTLTGPSRSLSETRPGRACGWQVQVGRRPSAA